MAEEGKGGYSGEIWGYSEHDDRVVGRGFSGRRKKGRGPFRGKMYSEMNRNSRNRGGTGPSSSRQRQDEDDGDVAMSDAHDAPRGRYLPYGPRPSRARPPRRCVVIFPPTGSKGGRLHGTEDRRNWVQNRR
ncbi:nuclear RNA export factor 1-like [Coturnix japonica]|uniref:nuclear RNA export factor 1-like n=1 Tax=Coturnix japonica TaxID=93934 RepID=UPI0013A5E25A|nr:nuclear RNA export factor 1-like [Coturnix japonica]